MSEIKKGDWVYTYGDGREGHVFQCDKVEDGAARDKNNIAMPWRPLEYCHRLEPLKRGDKLEVGDRVAVIERESNIDPGIGTIHRIIGLPLGYKGSSPRIDFTPSGWFMKHCELSRLPDCAQDRPPESADTENVLMKIRRNLVHGSSKKETLWADDVSEYFNTGSLRDCHYCGAERPKGLRVGCYAICESCATLSKEEREEVRRHKDDQPIPYVLNEEHCKPCPHPKYDGSLWAYCDDGYRITWDGFCWVATCTRQRSSRGEDRLSGVDPVAFDLYQEEHCLWTLIEYGGCKSEPVVKLKKNVSFGWDPYGLG
jgi:hypothetical protein